jgi:CheY-like chemotaxis protein/predicted regulator of Ras-like GTPase activity (Roadblock/LC7/MglB family)
MPKVLVVDDSLSVRKVVEKALEGQGLQVLAAASGSEAIEMLERDRPDVVICDVVLPDKDGYQICQYVRSHAAMGATPVLLISGIDNGTVQARAAEVRSDEVLFKPFGVDDLVRKIDRLLSRGANGSATRENGATPSERDRAAAPESPGGIKERLAGLAATPGVRFAVLSDREGFLIEAAGDLSAETDEVAGALASCLAEASDGIGRELGQGQLLGTILEYEAGTLLLQAVGPAALLAVLVDEPGALGKIRYYVRKVVPELARAL